MPLWRLARQAWYGKEGQAVGEGRLKLSGPGRSSRPYAELQSFSPVQLFMTPWTAAHQAPLSSTICCSLLSFMSIKSVMLSNHLVLCCLLFLLLPVFPNIWVFSNESALGIRGPNCWSFSFSISLSNEYSGLISFRIDGFDLAVQGTLKSPPAPWFKSINSSALSFLFYPALNIHTWLLEKPYLWLSGPIVILLAKWYFCFLICYLGLS